MNPLLLQHINKCVRRPMRQTPKNRAAWKKKTPHKRYVYWRDAWLWWNLRSNFFRITLNRRSWSRSCFVTRHFRHKAWTWSKSFRSMASNKTVTIVATYGVLSSSCKTSAFSVFRSSSSTWLFANWTNVINSYTPRVKTLLHATLHETKNTPTPTPTPPPTPHHATPRHVTPRHNMSTKQYTDISIWSAYSNFPEKKKTYESKQSKSDTEILQIRNAETATDSISSQSSKMSGCKSTAPIISRTLTITKLRKHQKIKLKCQKFCVCMCVCVCLITRQRVAEDNHAQQCCALLREKLSSKR